MELTDPTFLAAVFNVLMFASPYWIAWLVAIIFSAIMLSRGGQTPEKLLLVGSCIMFVEVLVSTVVTSFLPVLIYNRTGSAHALGLAMSFVHLFFGLIAAAGILCLILGFWKKFKSSANVQSAT